MLTALLDAQGRVVGRQELARLAGTHSARRCDSILVTLRRVLGASAFKTVRGRGWYVDRESLAAPIERPVCTEVLPL